MIKIIPFKKNIRVLPDAMQKTLDVVDRQIASRIFETFEAVTPEGKIVERIKLNDYWSGVDHVDICNFDKEKIKEATNSIGRCVATHVHPGGGPLSPTDIVTGFDLNFLQVRSVSTPVNGFIKRHIIDLPEEITSANIKKAKELAEHFQKLIKDLPQNLKVNSLLEKRDKSIRYLNYRFQKSLKEQPTDKEWEIYCQKIKLVQNYCQSLYRKRFLNPLIAKMNDTFESTFHGLKFREEFLLEKESNLPTNSLQSSDRGAVL